LHPRHLSSIAATGKIWDAISLQNDALRAHFGANEQRTCAAVAADRFSVRGVGRDFRHFLPRLSFSFFCTTAGGCYRPAQLPVRTTRDWCRDCSRENHYEPMDGAAALTLTAGAVHYSAPLFLAGRIHLSAARSHLLTRKKQATAVMDPRPLGAHPAGPRASATIRRPSQRSGVNDPMTSIK
jgi:hypothetical protein